MAETVNKRGDGGRVPLFPGETSRTPPLPSKSVSSGTSNALAFWGYFTVAVSLVTLLFISLPHFERTDERSWVLSLPEGLRRHYSSGKFIKVIFPGGVGPNQVFAVEFGPLEAETVLLIHGLGCSSYSFRRILKSLAAGGIRAVAVDLPGSGFSDNLNLLNGARWGHSIGWFFSIYAEIKEKGLFWGFDQLIQTGNIQERPARALNNEDSGYGTVVMGHILGQVIDSMALEQVHLVLHDSALCAGLNWASANTVSVSSVTLMDTSPQSAAFPSTLLRFPVIGHLLLGSKTLFSGMLRLCCAKSIDGSDAEAYRLLLKRKNDGRDAAAAWKASNHSLNVSEWANSDELKGLPVQILWSNSLSDRWIDEGRIISAEIPRAKFTFHSGRRWPQEDAAEEISGLIVNFVSSLPESFRRIEEDSAPANTEKMFQEASHQVHHHHQDHHDDLGHSHGLDYMGMHGLGHGW